MPLSAIRSKLKIYIYIYMHIPHTYIYIYLSEIELKSESITIKASFLDFSIVIETKNLRLNYLKRRVHFPFL